MNCRFDSSDQRGGGPGFAWSPVAACPPYFFVAEVYVPPHAKLIAASGPYVQVAAGPLAVAVLGQDDLPLGVRSGLDVDDRAVAHVHSLRPGRVRGWVALVPLSIGR